MIDPPIPPIRCPIGKKKTKRSEALCPLDRKLKQVKEMTDKVYKETTIGELIALEKVGMGALC